MTLGFCTCYGHEITVTKILIDRSQAPLNKELFRFYLKKKINIIKNEEEQTNKQNYTKTRIYVDDFYFMVC